MPYGQLGSALNGLFVRPGSVCSHYLILRSGGSNKNILETSILTSHYTQLARTFYSVPVLQRSVHR